MCLVVTFFGCMCDECIMVSWCGLNEGTDDAIRGRAVGEINVPLKLGDDLDDSSERRNCLISVGDGDDWNDGIGVDVGWCIGLACFMRLWRVNYILLDELRNGWRWLMEDWG